MTYHKRHTNCKRFIQNVSIMCLLAIGATNAAAYAQETCETSPCSSDLMSDSLAASWDEGMPLGNATVGALVWRKENALRLSLDRTDLWDLRPSDSLAGDNYRFEWVKQHIRQKNYLPDSGKLLEPPTRPGEWVVLK